MKSSSTVKIEGYTADELLALADDDFHRWVFCGEPVVLRIGSAEILGEFRLNRGSLTLELAQIEGGGEGALPLLAAVAERYGRAHNLREIQWVVHAVNCAKPNLKLRRVLERRGFKVREVPGGGVAYCLTRTLPSA